MCIYLYVCFEIHPCRSASLVVITLFDIHDVTDVSTVEDIPELLSSCSLFSMLLPLILAYIGPVAASVPKVKEFLFVELATLGLDVTMTSLL